MYSQSNPHDQSNESYQQSEMNNQPYSSDPPPSDQLYQQRKMTDPPYSPNLPDRGYQYSSNPSGYQRLSYQENQVPYEKQNYGPSNNMVRRSDMGGMYAESRYETHRDAMGNLVESHQQVFEDQNQIRANIRYWASTILYFLLGLIEVILLLRFIFRLLGANQDNSFITFLYGLSYPFVVAFHGIFDARTLGKSGVFEFSTLIAIIIYALLVWGLVSLVRVLFAPIRASRQTVTTSRRNRY